MTCQGSRRWAEQGGGREETGEEGEEEEAKREVGEREKQGVPVF